MECLGEKFIDYTIKPIKRQVNYLVNYGSNLENLRIKVDDLRNAKDDLEMLVDREKRNGKRILHTVEEWMARFEKVIKKANILLEEYHKAKAKCTLVKACYQRSKKATKSAKGIDRLLLQKDGFSNIVSIDAHPQKRWITPTRDYEPLTSRILLAKQILKEFENDNISLIGVYGIGGVGKTTLAKEVAREAKKLKLFDDVVPVLDLKENPKLKKIQKDIAEGLGLKFPKGQNINQKADRLFDRMKDKKVLVILDDVREEIELEKVGLHSGVCKILMTSRTRQVFLSPMMCTQKEFRLDTLNAKETWDLFVKIVGDVVNDSKIKRVAIEVANRCGGLPVLVVTVAAALKNKNSIHSWKDVRRRLKNLDDKEEDLQERAYSGIEWSYSQLVDDETKNLFLFCCVLYYDFLSDLLKYSLGMGLFSNKYHTVEEVRHRLHTLVDKLKDSCLLLDCDSNEEFKLHDLVREVGISIKCKNEKILSTCQKRELKEWPDNDFLKKCIVMDFSSLDIFCGFPNQSSECPKLEIFRFIQHRYGQHSIPSNFFKEMTALKVLDLTKFNIESLPSSFIDLTNLKTLCLDQSKFGDISLIGQLRNLEILSLTYSIIKQLPKEIGQLTHLKWLDLSYCEELEIIVPNVLSSLTSLEELKMRKSFNKWETEGNASLSELKKLSQLTTLEIHIPKSSLLPMNLFSNKLENFKVLIGDTWDWIDVSQETSINVLKLKLVGSTSLDIGLKRLVKKSEILYLDEMKGMDNIFSQFESEGFQYLKHFHVQNNTEIRYFIPSFGSNNSNIDVFPSLESLVLQNLPRIEHLCPDHLNYEPFKNLTSIKVRSCPNLKRLLSFSIVCSGHLNYEPFKKLTSIKVQSCPNLKRLLSFSIAKCLSKLEEMKVVDCNIMEEIVGREKDNDDDYLIYKVDVIIEFNKMRLLILKKLPMLVGFSSKGNNIDDESRRINELPQRNHDSNKIIEELDVHASTKTNELQLFNGEVLLPSLEALDLSSIPSNILWGDQLSTSSSSWVQNLKTLRVSNCDGLKFLLSSSMASSMVQLKHLIIMRCVELTDIVSLTQGDNAIIKVDEIFSKLESMTLVDLPNLVGFNSTSQYRNFQMGLAPHDYSLFDGMVQFPSLVHMKISRLDKVTTIWHNKLPPNSFCALKEVKIEFCPSVDAFVKHHHAFLSNLNSIEIRNCSNLKNVIPASLAGSLQGLEQLVVKHCGVLEEILKKEEEHETNQLIIFEFPKVKFVKFISLPQLRSFYGGLHSSKWPSLTHLKVLLGRNKNKVQILAKEHSGFQEKCNVDNPCTPIKQPLFLIEQGSFPNLKKLGLSAAMEVCDDPTTAACLCKAKDFFFAFNNVNSPNIFLTNCFRYFHGSFEGLRLSRALFSEIFVDADIEQEFGTLPHLKALVIGKMPFLTNLWKENSQTASVLPNLEFLHVFECDSLNNIVSSAISFHNLTMLTVSTCHGLKYLVTYSVAKSLTQLKSMLVSDCKRMRVIVESRDGDNDEDDGNNNNNTEIVFGKLWCLKLDSLPTLGGFCSGNDHCCVKVPTLKTLDVTDCNIELKISDEGVLLQSHSNLEAFQQITTQLDVDVDVDVDDDVDVDVDDDETVPVQDINVDDYDDYDYIYDNDTTWLAVLIQSKC